MLESRERGEGKLRQDEVGGVVLGYRLGSEPTGILNLPALVLAWWHGGGMKREDEAVRAERQAFDLDIWVAVLRWAPKRRAGRGGGQEELASRELSHGSIRTPPLRHPTPPSWA